MATIHPDYALLAARIAVSNLHKETDKSFSKTMEALYHYIDPKTGERAASSATKRIKPSRNTAPNSIRPSSTTAISSSTTSVSRP